MAFIAEICAPLLNGPSNQVLFIDPCSNRCMCVCVSVNHFCCLCSLSHWHIVDLWPFQRLVRCKYFCVSDSWSTSHVFECQACCDDYERWWLYFVGKLQVFFLQIHTQSDQMNIVLSVPVQLCMLFFFYILFILRTIQWSWKQNMFWVMFSSFYGCARQ